MDQFWNTVCWKYEIQDWYVLLEFHVKRHVVTNMRCSIFELPNVIYSHGLILILCFCSVYRSVFALLGLVFHLTFQRIVFRLCFDVYFTLLGISPLPHAVFRFRLKGPRAHIFFAEDDSSQS